MRILALFVLLVATACAALPRVTLSFNGNNPPGSVEYFAEQQQTGGTSWSEVAKGSSSPLSFDLSSSTPGVYTFRVRARLPGIANSESGSSNSTAGIVPPVAPSGVTAVVLVASIEIKKDGTMLASMTATRP